MDRMSYDIRNIEVGDEEEVRLLENENLLKEYKELGMNEKALILIKNKINCIKSNKLNYIEYEECFDKIKSLIDKAAKERYP